jgi:hypothetical protein
MKKREGMNMKIVVRFMAAANCLEEEVIWKENANVKRRF